MNYELAKELKDAGFPQRDGAYWVLLTTKRIKDQRSGEWYTRLSRWNFSKHIVLPIKGLERALDYAHVPTLSELIEACGEGFAGLHKYKYPGTTGAWMANHWDLLDPIGKEGNTPEEAVARLWLVLQSQHGNDS